MRISCRLTFNVNFKPLTIKIGWELDILCYIFWNSKIWRATFALFLVFYYFSVSFYPIWMKNLSKFKENVGLQAYYLGLVFSCLSQKNWEDRDRWSAWTSYSLVRFSVPFRSYEPDLEALFGKVTSQHSGCRDRPEFNQVEFFHLNVSRRSWDSSMNVCDKFWCIYIDQRLPGVVLSAKVFPLYQVL